MTDAQLREALTCHVENAGSMALRILGRKAGLIPGAYSQSEDAGKPFNPVRSVTDGPLWDQDDHASNVTGMAE